MRCEISLTLINFYELVTCFESLILKIFFFNIGFVV